MDDKVESSRTPDPDAEDHRVVEDDASSTLLDLTSYQLHDLDAVVLPSNLTELDLTANRLSSLDSRIGHLYNLKKLSFRQNLITDAALQPLSGWHEISGLEELVLRDNQLTTIPDVSIFKRFLVFDVSFNKITSLHGLSKVSNTLKELYVSKNEVTKMEEIDHFHGLQVLEFGSNKIRVMENLQNFKNLQELWLGRNRIKMINLCGLKCIKKISLQSNRLTSMLGFESCIDLEELYLSHNGITKMEGLSSLANLRVLDVSSNKLTSIDDIQNQTQLEDIWLNDNQIESIEGIAEAVAGSREKLTTIYLANNPCARTPNYSAFLKEIFSNIQQIDSVVFY